MPGHRGHRGTGGVHTQTLQGRPHIDGDTEFLAYVEGDADAEHDLAVDIGQGGLQRATGELGVDVLDHGFEQTVERGRSSLRRYLVKVFLYRIVQFQHIAELVGGAGEELVDALVDHRQRGIERRHRADLVAQRIDLGQHVEQQRLVVDIEQLDQHLAASAARLGGDHHTKGLADVRPGEDQAGVGDGEGLRRPGLLAARQQQRDAEGAREDHIVRRRAALDLRVDDVEQRAEPDFIRAQQAVAVTGHRVDPRVAQVDGEADAGIHRQVRVGQADLDETDVPLGLDVGLNAQVGHAQFGARDGVGVDVKAHRVDPEDQVQGEVETVFDVPREVHLAAEGLDLDIAAADQFAADGQVEARAGIVDGEDDVVRNVVEVVENIAQLREVADRLADLVEHRTAGGGLEQPAEDGTACDGTVGCGCRSRAGVRVARTIRIGDRRRDHHALAVEHGTKGITQQRNVDLGQRIVDLLEHGQRAQTGLDPRQLVDRDQRHDPLDIDEIDRQGLAVGAADHQAAATIDAAVVEHRLAVAHHHQRAAKRAVAAHAAIEDDATGQVNAGIHLHHIVAVKSQHANEVDVVQQIAALARVIDKHVEHARVVLVQCQQDFSGRSGLCGDGQFGTNAHLCGGVLDLPGAAAAGAGHQHVADQLAGVVAERRRVVQIGDLRVGQQIAEAGPGEIVLAATEPAGDHMLRRDAGAHQA